MVLLVIDTQELLMSDSLYHFDLFVSNVKELITCARRQHIEVIYIRHDDGEQKALTKSKKGYAIYKSFQPQSSEKVYDKFINSIFKETGLLDYLKTINEHELIITGLQSDYCINTSIITAYEHGFQVYVPAYANTTMDNEYFRGEQLYHYFNECMWNDRFATCLTMEEMFLKMKDIQGSERTVDC